MENEMNDETTNETIQPDHETTPGSAPETSEATDDAPAKLVPVAEAKRYRKRAQAAEKVLEEMKAELAEKASRLEAHARDLAELQRSRDIDECLLEADAIDLEAARLLTEMALSEMDEPDVGAAVDELRRRKPWLFRHRARSAGASSPHQTDGETPRVASLHDAAARAGETGRRSDLLRYLRLRRAAS